MMRAAASTPFVITDAAPLRYAKVLEGGTRLGLALLLASFVLYVAGVLPPHVPLERLPELWSLPVGRYLELTGAPTGWRWIWLLHHGDMLCLTGIALLAAWSGVCMLALLPIYKARGDTVYVVLCVAQLAVLLVAASGLLGAGH
jgi:hypothetical protein